MVKKARMSRKTCNYNVLRLISLSRVFQEYIDKFQQHGYCSLSYIASMTRRVCKLKG